MTTHADMLYHLGGVPVLSGIPFGPSSEAFFWNPTGGDDTFDGTTPDAAKKTLTAAFNLTTSGNNDTIFAIGGSTADTLAAALTWDHDYTHLVGMTNGLPGIGNRCRAIGGTTTDLTEIITVSATGCLFKNITFNNETDANVDSGSVVVSGNRNAFYNCQISGMLHATPAARAGSYSLTVSGVENHFNACYIGVDTITRGAANAELVMSGSKNSFWDCTFASQSETAGKFAIKVSGAGTNTWKNCLFHNTSVNWAQALTNAFNVSASSTHFVVLSGQCQFIGYTGVADVVTHIYGAGAAPNVGMYLSTNPTT